VYEVAVADVNGDGKPDLIVTYTTGTFPSVSGVVAVLLGNGDGTFQPPRTISLGERFNSVAVADVNGDGKPDLIVTYPGAFLSNSGTVTVLLGNGDGSFQQPRTFATGATGRATAVGDINGDGRPDLVVVGGNSGSPTYTSISVLLGNGDGSFQPQRNFVLRGVDLPSVRLADVNGDGRLDLIAANSGANSVSVLLGNGDGSFQNPQSFAVGITPNSVEGADVNGDGHLDLVVTNFVSKTVSVLLGNGDGSFQPQQTFVTGKFPVSVAVADLDGDGRLDLVVANEGQNPIPGSVSVLLGNGDGSFQDQQTFATGTLPFTVATGDLNGDGKPDLITPNLSSNTVSVLLGNGDGTFQPQQTFATGKVPMSVAEADVNGDGRPDLVVANNGSKSVSVLLGNGDGTFQPQQTFPVSPFPRLVAVADINGDHKPDLIVSDSLGVGVLLGNGDGTFQAERTVAPGVRLLTVADVNGDGIPDLIVANGSNVGVLLGNGDGTFGPQLTSPAGGSQSSATVADVNGDGIPDLVVTHSGSKYRSGTVSVLLGNGDGTFRPDPFSSPGLSPGTFAVGRFPTAVAVADLTGDGRPDLVVANMYGNNVSVLLGNGDGSFLPQQTFAAGSVSRSVAVADVNGDGRPDLVVANEAYQNVSVLLGNGDGTFTPSTSIKGVALRNTPYLADLTGDGILDGIVLDRSGNILFRKGLGTANQFAPPVILNDTFPETTVEDAREKASSVPETNSEDVRTARDLTVLHTGTGWAIATADALPDPNLFSPNSNFVYTLSLYTVAADGSVRRTTTFSTTLLPTRIAAADLTDPAGITNGLDELVVANALDNSVTIAFPPSVGTTWRTITVPVGVAPSDITFADVNGDGLLDVVVSDQASGDVTVLFNDATHSFATSARFRAGTRLYGLDTSSGSPMVSSLAQSVSLASGNFTGDGRNDLVVVNRGAHSFSVLPNDGNGGFADPQPILTTSTSDVSAINDQPGPVVAADFHRAGMDDVATLMKDRGEVWIYTNRGDGTFAHTFSIAVGSEATGLTLVPGSHPGLFDLLVGNQFGDILRLQGKGDGTFQIAGNGVSLAVKDLRGDGKPDVIVANQASNRVTIQEPGSGGAGLVPVVTLSDGSQVAGLAPGAVQWAKLDKPQPGANSFYDALVVQSGSDDLLVYRGTGFDAAGRPTFAAPQAFFVGTDPAGVTIQDFNKGHAPDLLVANNGSNDVSVIVGSWDASGQWVGTLGPRLQSGGSGPVAVRVVNDPGSLGGQDLVVTNGQSGTLTVLPGVGQGFFNDQNPQTLVNLGTSLPSPPSFLGDTGRGVVAATDGRLLGFDLNSGAHPTLFTPPPGEEVSAVGFDPNTGNVVVAEQGGTVQVLQLNAEDTAAAVVETLTPLTGIPSDPSALDVLETALGLQVLVTNAGSDQVFVFGTSLAAPLTAQELTLPGLPPGGPIAEASSPTEAPLTVVLTLVAGLLPGETTTLPGTTAGDLAATGTAPDQASTAATGNGVSGMEVVQGASDNNDTGDETPTDSGNQPSSESERTIKEILRKLELYRRTPETIPLGPVTLGQMMELPRLGAEALAALWQAGTDWLTGVAGSVPPPPVVPHEEADAAEWLSWSLAVNGEQAATRVVAGEADQGPSAMARVMGEGEQPAAVEVGVPADGVVWGKTLLATLAVGGLALWAERQLLRAAEFAERPRRPRV
jgi:hypothetical protein